MNPNNSGFIIEDELNESDFTADSSIGGMNMKQIVDRIQKLEEMAIKNVNGTNVGEQFGMMQIGWKMGKEIGELKNKMDGMKEEMAKMKEELNGLKAENKELKEEVEKLEEINEEKFNEIEIMKKGIEGLKQENGKLKEELEGNGHAFREMKNEMMELKAQIVEKDSRIEEFEAEINGLKKENAEKMEGIKKAIEQLKRSKNEENHAFEKLKEENEHKLREMAEIIAQIGGKNAELDGQITELKGENAKLGGKTNDLEKQFENLPFLTKIIDGIQWARYNSNEYKSHLKVGPKLTISKKEFIVKHAGPNGTNIVLANMPIPGFNLFRKNKRIIAFYFEIEILSRKQNCNAGIVIGFCGKHFPLEGNWLGNENTDSIGIRQKGVMQIDGCLHKFGNVDGYFSEGDFVGIGIIHHRKNSKMECFGTWNGKLMGKVELLPKFIDLPLFPAINLYYAGDSIRINFDMDKFKFKEFGHALQ